MSGTRRAAATPVARHAELQLQSRSEAERSQHYISKLKNKKSSRAPRTYYRLTQAVCTKISDFCARHEELFPGNKNSDDAVVSKILCKLEVVYSEGGEFRNRN